ncbi:MAG: S1C family serine protease [Verrucomicrobiota bacterium JB023]|nr:S1C family serine protease [Verrucomicrobiota bacterium JB023]
MPASSELVYLDEQGLAAAVTALGVNPRQGQAGDRKTILVAHDPVSRLSLLRVPLETGESTRAEELGSTLNLEEGAVLLTSLEGGEEASRLVSRESTYKGKPLPLELMRVHHPPEIDVRMGAPLYDAAGRLLGISYRRAQEFGNGTFVFPAEAIERVWRGSRKNEIVERSWFGVELLATDPMPVVQGVLQNSPAAAAGLQKGDILLKIGERRVANYAAAVNAFYYLLEGKPTDVLLLRGTERLSLTVVPELVPAATVSPALPAQTEPTTSSTAN